MLRLATALVAGLLLAFGLAACGGGNSDVSDVIPKSTPDLVAPKDTSLPDVTISTTATTNSVTTPTTSSATGTGATGSGTGAAGTGATGTGAAGTGGTGGGTASGGTSTTGGGSSSGGFSGFCQGNPGACKYPAQYWLEDRSGAEHHDRDHSRDGDRPKQHLEHRFLMPERIEGLVPPLAIVLRLRHGLAHKM
jgi:hypothetical protein